jgi:hypothetical protein
LDGCISLVLDVGVYVLICNLIAILCLISILWFILFKLTLFIDVIVITI